MLDHDVIVEGANEKDAIMLETRLLDKWFIPGL